MRFPEQVEVTYEDQDGVERTVTAAFRGQNPRDSLDTVLYEADRVYAVPVQIAEQGYAAVQQRLRQEVAPYDASAVEVDGLGLKIKDTPRDGNLEEVLADEQLRTPTAGEEPDGKGAIDDLLDYTF